LIFSKNPSPYQELEQLPRFGEWEGETTKFGTPMVQFGAGGNKTEYER